MTCGAYSVELVSIARVSEFSSSLLKDFNSATVGGEWLVPLGNYFEAGAGASFSRRMVPSVYQALVNADGSEIEQAFILRLIPVAFTVRVLPLGQSNGVLTHDSIGI